MRSKPAHRKSVLTANWSASRQEHWETVLAARAIENQAYVAGVNRVRQGGNLEFWGGSKIISPPGKTWATGGRELELIVADLDIDEVRSWREQFRCLQDRQAID